jgi:hypothetical protein
MLRDLVHTVEVEDVARFLTLANRELYSGQNAWIFHDRLTQIVRTRNQAMFGALLAQSFDYYPIKTNPLLTEREKEEIGQILYRDYIHILNKFVKCDVNECNSEVFGCMSITDRNVTTNIICKGVDVTINEFGIEKKDASTFVNTQIGEDLKMPFADIIKRVFNGGLVNVSETVNNAIYIKFGKEIKCYQFAMDSLSS